jgi:hypothetical protein
MIAPALLASTAIILLSFVSEDAATISSALSIFGGPLSWLCKLFHRHLAG